MLEQAPTGLLGWGREDGHQGGSAEVRRIDIGDADFHGDGLIGGHQQRSGIQSILIDGPDRILATINSSDLPCNGRNVRRVVARRELE